MDMKTGNLEPDLVMTVEDAGGVANLNQVTAWRLVGKLHGTLVLDAVPDTAVVDSTNSSKAVLTRPWVAGETDVEGDMLVEAVATWPGGRKQTFPAVSYEVVRFRRGLD